jgi:hypothetical protein
VKPKDINLSFEDCGAWRRPYKALRSLNTLQCHVLDQIPKFAAHDCFREFVVQKHGLDMHVMDLPLVIHGDAGQYSEAPGGEGGEGGGGTCGGLGGGDNRGDRK